MILCRNFSWTETQYEEKPLNFGHCLNLGKRCCFLNLRMKNN